MRFALLLAVCLSGAGLAQTTPSNPAELVTDPAHVTAFAPFHVTATATYPGFAVWGSPTAQVEENTITVFLNGECGFLCSSSSRRARSFELPALKPGEYQLVINPGSTAQPGAPASARLIVAAPTNYQGLWWASPPGSESGWGLQIAHQEETLFVTWYTYDTDGSPTWFVMSSARRLAPRRYGGTLYRTRALPQPNTTWQLAESTEATIEGSAILDFSGPNGGTFTWMVGDRMEAKAITRQVFAGPVPTCTASSAAPAGANYQDLWWQSPAGSTPGWGLQIAHQGDRLFVTLFGYDGAGRPSWQVVSDIAEIEPGLFRGWYYRTRGPAYNAPSWRNDAVTANAGGILELSFSGRDHAVFRTSDGVVDRQAGERRDITRQVFAAYRTVCQ